MCLKKFLCWQCLESRKTLPIEGGIMKIVSILLVALFSINGYANQKLPGIINESTVNKIMCEDKLEIKDHMARMGFIIRSLREMVDNIVSGYKVDELKAIVMVDTQVLRTHLTAVLPKTPAKIVNYDPENIQKNKIIFQRYLVKMIGYTIDLEEELLKVPMNPDQIQAQRLKIASLIIKIDETVNEAHSLFRY